MSHGEGGSAEAESFHGVGCRFEACGHLLHLFGREFAEHEVYLSAARKIVAHAEAQAAILLRAELFGNVLQAVLAGVAEAIGQQYAAGMPLNLFCHSMGGGIGAAVLERYPTLFDKAVLSAPMVAPATGMPLGVARVLVGALCGLGFGKKRVFGQSDFTPEFSMEGNEGASEARERWYFKLRCENSEYQTYCAAFEWVRQALKLNRAILNPSACAEVETPVLLFQSGRDIWVLNKPQNHFVQLVKDGGGEANIVRFPESRHEIFSMPNSTYKPYLEKILGFYDDPMIACAAY